MNNVLLHSTKKGSDKVYLLKLVAKQRPEFGDVVYDVIYANGRRTAGATAGNKAKNTKPLSLNQAQALLTDLMYEKMETKGYHEMGGCNLCGGSTSTRNKKHLIITKEPEVVQLSQQQEQNELVKTYAPTWYNKYERTVAFDDEDL